MKIVLMTCVAAFVVLFGANFFGQELPAGDIWDIAVRNDQISKYVAQAVGGSLFFGLVAWFFVRRSNKSKA